QAAQSEFVTDVLGVFVLVAVDRVPSPADDEVGVGRLQHAGVAQQAEHGVRDAAGGVEFVGVLGCEFDRGVNQIAYDGSEQFGDAADDLAVDEGNGGRVLQVDAHAAVHLPHLDVEVRVQLLRGARVVGGAAGREHGKGAAAQQVVHAAARGVAQARDLVAGEDVESTAR